MACRCIKQTVTVWNHHPPNVKWNWKMVSKLSRYKLKKILNENIHRPRQINSRVHLSAPLLNKIIFRSFFLHTRHRQTQACSLTLTRTQTHTRAPSNSRLTGNSQTGYVTCFYTEWSIGGLVLKKRWRADRDADERTLTEDMTQLLLITGLINPVLMKSIF